MEPYQDDQSKIKKNIICSRDHYDTKRTESYNC